MGFNMLSMANNHAWDLGLNGLLAGIREVSKRGFAYAGTGAHADAAAAARGDDDLRNEAIGAGVGSIADEVNCPVQNLVRADQLRQRLAELPRRTRNQRFGNAIFCGLTNWATDPSSVWF
jgi:hypothetical protein